ncbi:MAG TPA: ABC transporter ATP-binding protein [Candidatus Thermoplasmatota archaeon]|nr:ABC transporter ATP-binding protein [Candidatus Thermoplasmatota archaeon]
MGVAVETRGLTRAFGGFVAVDHLDLRVDEGEVFGFLGLNGAGKSTTIKMLATLLAPSAGTARVAGHDVVADPVAVRAAIGLVADEGAEACGSWSPREYLGYFARLRGLPRPGERVERALDEVALRPEWRGRALSLHSTGMRRRVDVARALLASPRVLFLDEPARGLDLPAKLETWDLLRRLAADEGVTVFLSSHEAPEIQALCRRVAVLASGRLTYDGPAASLGRDAEALASSLVRLLDPDGEASKRSKPAVR